MMKYNETLMNEVSSPEMVQIEGGGPIFDYWAPRLYKFFKYVTG